MRNPRSARRTRREAGFTLIELMVVIVILGLLAGLVGPNVFRNLQESKVSLAKTTMASIQGAVQRFRIKKNKLPESLDELKDEFDGGEVPKDPWDHEYKYTKVSRDKYELMCFGADGEEGGEDEFDKDISLADIRKSSSGN
ncbi:MAG: Type II secretion system protein G [Planctomycetes bacterium]|nr:Type II secretion system protein G [Planctomycetota bacterium]